MEGFEKAFAFLQEKGYGDRVLRFDVSTATVPLAAQAVGCEDARIAKSLTFYDLKGEGAILVLAAGDVKVDNRRFKDQFGYKAKMLKGDDVHAFTGYDIGGVCPFDIPKETPIYFDESLYRFDVVYPACGDAASAVRLTIPELETLTGMATRVDVGKGWRDGEA